MKYNFDIEKFVENVKEQLKKPASEAFTPFTTPFTKPLSDDSNLNTELEPIPPTKPILTCIPSITFDDTLYVINDPINKDMVKQECRLRDIDYLIDANDHLQKYMKMEQYESALMMSNLISDKLKKMLQDEY